MKRIICAALAAAMLTTGAAAYQVPHQNESDNIITHYDANCDPQAQAEMLQKLGLFLGTDKGFELDRTMSRVEAAAMLCRFLGGAEVAAQGGFPHPFTDVPAWANNAIGWLYQNKLTYGVTKTKYGADQPLDADQFSAFLSRAVCGGDDLKCLMLTDEEAEQLKGKPFLRSYAVAMSVRALSVSGGAGGGTLAEHLITQGVFTTEEFADAAWGIFSPFFRGNDAIMAYTVYAQCQPEDLKQISGTGDAEKNDLPYFYAYRPTDTHMEIYRVDWRTLESSRLGVVPISTLACSGNYLGQINGRDYLMLTDQRDDEWRYSLYSVEGKSFRLELSDEKIGKGTYDVIENSQDIVLSCMNGICRIDESGVSMLAYPALDGDSSIVYAGETSYVVQTKTDDQTTISCMRDNGELLQSYSVPRAQTETSNIRSLEYQEKLGMYQMLYGEAGLYQFDPKTGGLTQVISDPVVGMLAEGDTAFYLTHENGKNFSGMNKLGGDTIVRVNHATGEQETVLDASAGIPISDFDDTVSPSTGHLKFYTASDVGMQHFDQYFYDFDLGTKKITVLDFEAGRPEVMNDFDFNNPSVYKKPFIEAEQARLDEAWNSKH